MHYLGSRRCFWVQRINVLCCPEQSFPARISRKMHPYMNVKLAVTHFIYGVAQGNELAAKRIYMEQFPVRILSALQKNERLPSRLCASGSYYVSRHDKCREKYFGILDSFFTISKPKLTNQKPGFLRTFNSLKKCCLLISRHRFTNS